MLIMNGVNGMIPEFSAAVSAAVGYGTGKYLERQANVNAAKSIQEMEDKYGVIKANAQQDEVTLAPDDKKSNRLTNIFSPTRILAAGGLALASLGILPISNPTPNTKPTLGVVIDRSAQTGYSRAAGYENSLLKSLGQDKKINLNFFIARGGSFYQSNVSANKLVNNINFMPAGAESISTLANVAIMNAAHNSTPIQSNVLGSAKKHNSTSALLFITDNNSIGQPKEVISMANKNQESIYILNVGNNQGPVPQELKTIAQKTQGQYQSINQQNLSSKSKQLINNINPAGTKKPEKPSPLQRGVDLLLALGALAGAAVSYKKESKPNFIKTE